MKAGARALLLALALPLRAQDAEPLAMLFFIGEWHLGMSPVPPSLQDLATDGTRRALGWSLPIPIAPDWQLRPRFDDGLFTGSEVRGPGTRVETRILQRHFGLDVLFTLHGDRWKDRPGFYLGTGLGLMQTFHERRTFGYLDIPGLPADREQESWAPAGRLCAGFQLTPWLALEAQVQTSAHHFSGTRYSDTLATFGLRFWPAVLLGRPATPR